MRYVSAIWGNIKPIPGLSAYEIAVKNGFVGTEAQWLASLVGADGAEVEFRENAGWVEWRYVGAASWTQLYEIPTLPSDNLFDVYIDFIDVEAFTYNCPYALKFTQVVSEGTAPALSVALNTNMAQFDKLTVTPAVAGLVILKGELL